MSNDRVDFGLMDGDTEYRGLILKLSRELPCDEVKYMLKPHIPAGKGEELTTTLNVFDFLEKKGFGPSNLRELADLLKLMNEHKLRGMVLDFLKTEHVSQMD